MKRTIDVQVVVGCCLSLFSVHSLGQPALFARSVSQNDILVQKIPLAVAEGQQSKVLERTSFDPETSGMKKDRCELSLRGAGGAGNSLGSSSGSSSRSVGDWTSSPGIHIVDLAPSFQIETFLRGLRKSLPQLFAEMILLDPVEGVVFRREAMKDQIGHWMEKAPLNQVPQKFRTLVEQQFVTHFWGCYGDLLKHKKESSSKLRYQISHFRNLWSEKLISQLESNLRSAHRGSSKSDLLSRTHLRADTQGGASSAKTQWSVHCVFEGDSSTVSMDRVNGVLSPYFEIRTQAHLQRWARHNPFNRQTSSRNSAP